MKDEQTYEEWNDGRDEMDGGNDGCYVMIVFLFL